MTEMMFKAFGKKLFGIRYKRIWRNLLVCVIVFWGLLISDFQVEIAPFILYLIAGTFTAGVMWQALSSEDNAANMKNMIMLPFIKQKLIFSYVGVLGAYTLITKTGLLFAVLFTVSSWTVLEIVGSVLCVLNAILMTACIYSFKKLRIAGLFWTGSMIVVIYLAGDSSIFLLLLMGNCLLAAIVLNKTDAYSFYLQASTKHLALKKTRHYSIWRYLLRYLITHKNYLINTTSMWFIACVLPIFLRQIENLFVLPMGFAVLSFNTPICILLSCDPALNQAVRFLPGQKRTFCIPYCTFIFLCNLTADIFFLCSWKIQNGSVTSGIILTSIFFALQSAISSVLLEWFSPLQKWKIESDLWHHPRKYVVPAAMLLLAGIVETLPWFTYILIATLLIECVVLLLHCRRC